MKEGSFVHRLFLFGLVLLEVGCTYSGAQCTPASGGVKRFGTNCQFRCHCLYGEQCDVDTGACPSGCSYNWTGPFCQYNNIALKEESRHSDNIYPTQYSYLANDRDIKSCSFTDGPTKRRKIAPWWAIWFSHDVVFNELVFTTKEEYLRYFPEFNVTVQKNVTEKDHRDKKVHEGELCYRQNKTIPEHSTVHVKCTTDLTGNQLRLQLANTSTQLVICDLRTSGGCPDRTWGANCTQKCGFCYGLSQCDPNNGNCTRCEVGYKPMPTCTEECKNGTYGENCGQICGKNCKSNSQEITCHHVNGTCLHGCNAGWQGDHCETKCRDGLFGVNCSQNCGTNCMNSSEENICHHVNGACLHGCNAGWQGDHCEAECKGGFYGENCSQMCGTNCHRNSEKNICHHVNGTCLHGCNAGWQGDHCETECKNGVYGVNCSQNCGTNCMNSSEENICHHVNGTCVHGCNAGWQGDHCEFECNEGTYGNNCINSCDKNCKNGVCDKETGECIDGCKPGYTGHKCEQECSYGYWGENCLRACGKCLSGSCDTYNGSCSGICQPGYKYKIYCDEECETGWYGNNCSNKCSSDCKDLSFCRKSDGLCVTGSSKTEVFVVVGGGIALAIIVTVVVVSIIWFRRHLQSRRTPYETNTNINIGSDSGNGFPDTASGVKSTSNTYEELQTGMRMEHEYDAL